MKFPDAVDYAARNVQKKKNGDKDKTTVAARRDRGPSRCLRMK